MNCTFINIIARGLKKCGYNTPPQLKKWQYTRLFQIPTFHFSLGKGSKKSDIYHLGGGQRGLIITFYFFLFLMPKKSFLDTKVFSSIGVGGSLGALGGTSISPFGPWQTLCVLRPSFCVVQLSFCTVRPSFCAVWPAFVAICMTFCISNTNFLKFF